MTLEAAPPATGAARSRQAPPSAIAKAQHVPYRWRNLLTLTGVSVVDNTESGLTATLFPSIAKSLSLNSGNLGAMAALGKLAAVPAGPAFTWLGGRIGRRWALVATSLTAGAFGIAAGLAQNFPSCSSSTR